VVEPLGAAVVLLAAEGEGPLLPPLPLVDGAVCSSVGTVTSRLSAETMPLVTVPARSSGEPMATTLVADRDGAGVAEGGGGQAAGAGDLDQRQVLGGVGADDRGGGGLAVAVGDLDGRGARDDVVVGDDLALLVRMTPEPTASPTLESR